MESIFNQVVNRKDTYCTQWDFAVDRFGTQDILPFSISDMDFRSPDEILDAIKHHTDHGVFGYTRWNHDDFKKAITNWYQKRFLATVSNDWVVYSPSVIYSISKLVEILTADDDYIVVQTPGYDAFFNYISHSNRRILENPLLYNGEQYELDVNDLEYKLSYSRAKVLLLCNPHNPTGRVWREEELVSIVNLCEQYNVKIISDDIHMDITYKDNTYIPITSITDSENVFICSSASKTFNTPALGGSYVFIPDSTVREQFYALMKYRDGVSSATIFGILSVIKGYNEADYWVDQLRSYVYNNMQIVKNYIDKELPMLKFTIPEATYLAWINCSALNVSNEQLQHALINEGKVGIMSGEVYRERNGCFLRMNVGCPEKKLIKGLEGVKMAVESIRR